MKLKQYCSAFLLMAILSMSSICLGYQPETKAKDEFWLNLPSSPLRITMTPNERFLTLDNYSSKQISGYQLGCVIENHGGIKILSRMKPNKTVLEPADPANQQVHFISLGTYTENLEVCRKRKAKLAVIEVTYSNGDKWEAK